MASVQQPEKRLPAAYGKLITDVPPLLAGGYRSLERDREMPLRFYWRILRKRYFTIFAVTAIALTLSALASLKATKKYEAVSHIAISKEANNSLRVGEENESGAAFDYSIELDTQASILRGTSLALQVISELNLSQNPAFNPDAASNPLTGHAALTPAEESAMLRIWNSGLAVSKVPRTRMIEIRFTSPDPRLAARIVNALTNAYVERNFKSRYESTMQATEWLSKQLTGLQLKVETSEQALVAYQKANGIVGLDEKQNITTDKLAELNRDLTSAENERMQKQALYGLAQREPANLPSLAGNSLFQRLKESESDLERQFAQLSTQYGPSFPRVLEVNSQLKQERSAVNAEVARAVGRAKIEYQSAFDRERMLRSALERQKSEATRLNEHSIEYSQLKREAESNRSLYDSLNQKLKEASVTSSLKLSNVSILDTARVPASPSSPNIRGNLSLGLLMGLLAGVGIAILLEALDNTVRTPEQVEELSALPSLGSVPLTLEPASRARSTSLTASTESNARKTTALISLARPRSKVAEAYRALRTSILLSATGRAPQLIMLTSALPQEGKTTTSVNTAIVLAQKGGRVLLIDADMRRPSLHQVFGLRPRDGLSSVLSGGASMQEAVISIPEIPNLYLLPAGLQPPNPAELLGSHVMREYLSRWRKQYDFIVVDTPPVLSVTDAVLLSEQMDAVILVLRSGKTTKEALRRTRQLFDKVNVRILGVVVNAVDLNAPDAQYYGYSYGYGESHLYYDDSAEAVGTVTN